MAAMTPTRAVSIRLLSDRGLSPSVIVYLNGSNLQWNTCIQEMATALHNKFPALQSDINLTSQGAIAARLHVVVDGHVSEIQRSSLNKKVVNDSRLVLTFIGSECADVIRALQASGIAPNGANSSIRSVRTKSGAAIGAAGLGKRSYRSYTTRLKVASQLHQKGNISNEQKSMLKDLIISGDRHLEDLIQKFEMDRNPMQLIAFLNSPQAQAAKARASSKLMESLASMSMDTRLPANSMDMLMMESIGDGLESTFPNSPQRRISGSHNDDLSFDMNFLSNIDDENLQDMFDDEFEDPFQLLPENGASHMENIAEQTLLNDKSIRPLQNSAINQRQRSRSSGNSSLTELHMARQARMRRFRTTFSDKLPNDVELFDLLADPENGVTVKKRTKRKLFLTETFPSCFVGAEAITWMTENIPFLYDSRDKALNLGKMLVRARLVAHVKHEKDFVDSPSEYYIFQKTREQIGLPSLEQAVAFSGSVSNFKNAEKLSPSFSLDKELASLNEFYRSEEAKRQAEHERLLNDQKRMHKLQLAQHRQRLHQIQRVKERSIQKEKSSTSNSNEAPERKAAAKAKKREEKMIGAYTATERKALLEKYFKKRERMKKNRLEGKGHQYMGRTKFANARPRVKGRFVGIEFMNSRGIKFDSEKPGWVCSTLGGKVFTTADEAVNAVDAANAEKAQANNR